MFSLFSENNNNTDLLTYQVAFKCQNFDENWWILFAVGRSAAKGIKKKSHKDKILKYRNEMIHFSFCNNRVIKTNSQSELS